MFDVRQFYSLLVDEMATCRVDEPALVDYYRVLDLPGAMARITEGWSIPLGLKEGVMRVGDNTHGSLTVVDAGCGFGTETLLFSFCLGESIGLDLDAGRIRTAKRRLQFYRDKTGYDNDASFLVGAADQLPFDGGSVDMVFTNSFLSHVSSPLEFFRESYRVLRKNGVLVCLDSNKMNPFVWLKTENARRGPKMKTKWIESLHEAVPYADERLWTPQDVRQMSESCGFKSTASGGGFVLSTRWKYIVESTARVSILLRNSPLSVFGGYLVLIARK